MFIKWQSRKSPKNQYISARHYAYLVKNYREGNKVKQKVVSYLGSIAGFKKRGEKNEVIGEKFYPLDKRDFYQCIQKNLNKLNISKKEKEKVLKSFSLKVPRPSLKEIKQAEAESKARLEELRASFNNIPNLIEDTINKLKRDHGEIFNSTSRIRTSKKAKNL